MRQASGNMLVVADIARFYPKQLDSQSAVLAKNRERFPNAFLPAMAMSEWEACQERYPQSRSAAEDGVRAAPRNVVAWLDLAEALYEESESIRQSKYTVQMTAQERQAVNRIYPQWLAAALQATKISPHDSYAWSETARAATFEGDMNLADKALWKAYELNPANPEIYYWGLQMYQPKWGGDKEKLLKVAQLAVQHAPADEFPRYFGNIVKKHLPEQQTELFKAALARVPGDAMMNYYVGVTYHYEASIPNYEMAEKYYRAGLQADPNHGRCLTSLGDLYYFVHNDPKNAELLYRRAIASEPEAGHFYANLARLLENTGRHDEAAIEAKKAAQFGAESSHPGMSSLDS
jgi:tetratricopeptide (TPR) repeat protein